MKFKLGDKFELRTRLAPDRAGPVYTVKHYPGRERSVGLTGPSGGVWYFARVSDPHNLTEAECELLTNTSGFEYYFFPYEDDLPE